MEDNKKAKTITLIITGLALIAALALIVNAKREQVATTQANEAAQAAATPPISLCYLLNAPAKSGHGTDVAYLEIETSDGGQTVTGELGTHPAGQTESSGTLTGSVGNDNGVGVLEGQYTTVVAGKTTTTPQNITLSETSAQVGSLTLPMVDCSQYPNLKAAAWK